MRWADRFESVVREWIRNDEHSMTEWARYRESGDFKVLSALADRGQVGADSDERTAVWGAFLHQRSHANAFFVAMAPSQGPWRIKNLQPSIGVLDLGCGLGTVAFAVDEFFTERAQIHYVGVDHNAPTLVLADRMIGAPLRSAGDASFQHTVADAVRHAIDNWPELDRIYVTSSYLFCQRGVTPQAVQDIASALGPLVDEAGPVRVLITDASGWRSQAKFFLDLFASDADRTIARRISDSYSYRMVYPDLTGDGYRQAWKRSCDGHSAILN